MKRILGLLLMCLVAACGRPPEIDAALGPEPIDAEYPEIIPFSEILTANDADFGGLKEENEALEDRVEELRKRAAALRALPTAQ